MVMRIAMDEADDPFPGVGVGGRGLSGQRERVKRGLDSGLRAALLSGGTGILQVEGDHLLHTGLQWGVGGRRGIHTEQFGYLLAELQHIARSHPGASW